LLEDWRVRTGRTEGGGVAERRHTGRATWHRRLIDAFLPRNGTIVRTPARGVGR
jgi:hypothetical protein